MKGFVSMCRRCVIALVVLTLLPTLARPADVEGVLADEVLLQKAGLPSHGPGLLDFFRRRSAATATAEQLARLIEQLGAAAPGDRDRAGAELVALGPIAVPLLRQAARDPDGGAGSRLANRCLQILETQSTTLSAAAVRLLALRRPEGAVETLLSFLPSAEDESVLVEVQNALAQLAYRHGQPEPVLAQALQDADPLRRAAAIDALCLNGRAEPRAALRKLLHDPVARVRLRAGLALAQARDGEAIGVLIDLLTELPMEPARLAEDFLQTLAGEQAPRLLLAEDEPSRQRCREAWTAWWQGSDGNALLEEFRKRTLTDDSRERVAKLVRRLGDEAFDVREQATADLKQMGALALPLLRKVAQDRDPEISQRARALLQELEKEPSVPLSPILPVLLALRKPAGAAEALLAFLPCAEDALVTGEVQAALNAVVAASPMVDPVVVRGLDDSSAVRRAAAAEALCLSGRSEHLPAIRRLLKDADAAGRLQVALALAGAREREAIPVLIDLLAELPAEQTAPIEDYLLRIAGDQAPTGLPTGEDALKKRRAAWAAWWTAGGAKVELVDRYLVSLPQHNHGWTLLVQPNANQVCELSQDGKPRWQLTGLLGPQDAHMLPGDRVLIAEYSGQRVTERSLKGDVLWQKSVPSWPISAQRLTNGNTLIVMRNQVVEVNRAGKEVFTYPRPTNDLLSARKTREGHLLCLTNQGVCFRLDATGKELKRYQLQGISNFGNALLDHGGAIVPIAWQNRVVEYDRDGRVVWDAQVMQPTSACRLANGNTLVATQQGPRLVELDRKGKQVAEMTVPIAAVMARRR